MRPLPGVENPGCKYELERWSPVNVYDFVRGSGSLGVWSLQ